MTLTVIEPTPVLYVNDGSASVDTLDYLYYDGELYATISPDPDQTFLVSNIGTAGTIVYWTLVEDMDWLDCDLATGSVAVGVGGDLVTASIGSGPLSALSPGTYTGAITLSGYSDATHLDALAPPTHAIAVTLTVEPVPVLALSDAPPLLYAAVEGGSAPASQQVQLTNVGSGLLDWDSSIVYGTATGWLQVSPASGTGLAVSPAETTLTLSIVGVSIPAESASDYTATITFSRILPGMSAQTLDLDVTLHVYEQATLTPSAASFSFVMLDSDTNPASQTFTMSNGGGNEADFAWSITPTESWLTATPGSGTYTGTPNIVTVSVEQAGLPFGLSTANLVISAPGTSNGPQTASVSFVIRPHIVINEVHPWWPDWVELYNKGVRDVDMTGYDLDCIGLMDDGDPYTFPNGFTLPASAYVVIDESGGADTATNLFDGNNWSLHTYGNAMLEDAANAALDFVRWGTDTTPAPGDTTWTGTDPDPAANLPATGNSGPTLARDRDSTDTDDGSDWDINSGIHSNVPTPGAVND